jgi:dihydroorotase-like cyclic amidohydrolase
MTQQTIILPGLIDPHVHLRDPGQTHKEDFYTGTSAALAGGYTMVLDMPNNAEPITTCERLIAKRDNAAAKVVADIGFNFGTLGDNFDEFTKVSHLVTALKVYLNVTTGNFIIDKSKLREIYEAWTINKPIMLHAEDDVSDLVWTTLQAVPKQTHMCHVSSQAELEFVIKAKDAGLPISCGVTPHHLFLTDKDAEQLGSYGFMKPYLKPQSNQDFLWAHMDYIDIIESDHAPHTKQEKDSDTPPFGVPGLETTLPLLLTAQQQGRMTLAQVIEKTHDNAARLFKLPEQPDTSVEVSLGEYELKNEILQTKAGWSPFAGQILAAKVKKVTLRGTIVYENGIVLASPGTAQLLP